MPNRKVNKETDLKINVEIIDRDDIPEYFFLPTYKSKQQKDWKIIYKFKFNNKLTYYYGTNSYGLDDYELPTYLAMEHNIFKKSKDIFKFQENYFKENDVFLSRQDTIKLFLFHKKNASKIKHIVNYLSST